MSLLDDTNMIHRVRIERVSYQRDGLIGNTETRQTVETDIPAWVQNASANEIIEFQKRDQVITDRVNFNKQPPLQVGDHIIVLSGPSHVGEDMLFLAEHERTAGFGLMYTAWCRIETNEPPDESSQTSVNSSSSSSSSSTSSHSSSTVSASSASSQSSSQSSSSLSSPSSSSQSTSSQSSASSQSSSSSSSSSSASSRSSSSSISSRTLSSSSQSMSTSSSHSSSSQSSSSVSSSSASSLSSLSSLSTSSLSSSSVSSSSVSSQSSSSSSSELSSSSSGVCCSITQNSLAGAYNFSTDPGPTSPPASPAEGNIVIEDYTNGRIIFHYDGSSWISHYSYKATSGSVPFIDTSGYFAQDNANLYWDDTNNELGIGAGMAPDARLDVCRNITMGELARFIRSGSAPTEDAFYVGDDGILADVLVAGDGRVGFGLDEGTLNAQLRVRNDDSGLVSCLYVDQNDTGSVTGMTVDTAGTTQDAVQLTANSTTTGIGLEADCNALTSGRIAYFKSSSSSVVTRNLVEILNSSTAAVNAIPFVVTQQAAEILARFRTGVTAATVVAEIHDTGHLGAKPLASNTDVTTQDDVTAKRWSLQKRSSPPTNSAYIAFTNNPGSDVFYLVLDEKV